MAAPLCRMAAITGLRFSLFIITYVYLLGISHTDGARLSDPKILLPYHSSVITNFTLKINLTKEETHVQDNCYTWRSAQEEVATIQLVNSTDGVCAFAAVISAVSKSPHRKTSIVLAENKVTREVLRCIVIVETLHRIEIQTTTRLLYLEDSPEQLTIRGFDEEGNVFSSLAGLRFEWSLEPDMTSEQGSLVDVHNILRILKFAESHYTTPTHIEHLEGRGLQGDTILVEGIRTGSANVKSVIKDPVYKNVLPSVVRIMVIANLMISPGEAFVLKYSTIKYVVELIKQNAIIEISMPSNQFYLEVQNTLIGELDAHTSYATALELGSTEIILMDKHINVKDTLRRPSAMLYVVNPSRLAFVVLPHRKWVLETGREYVILIEVYDKNSHKIYPSDNVIIEAAFPEKFFSVLYSTKNGTYHVVKTLQRGKTHADGALTTVIRNDGSKYPITPEVKQKQPLEIFDPIVVIPPELFFPWDPQVATSHQYQLQATGGSGEYVWKSSLPPVTAVNVVGEITTGNKGQAEVTAADTRNQVHTGTALVHVLPPSDMKFRPKYVEAAVGTDLQLPLAVFAEYKGKLREFNDCRRMRLNITFTDPKVFHDTKDTVTLPENGCRVVRVKAMLQGHTEIKASYIVQDIQLESVVTVAAYDPLRPVDPEREAVVAVGSQKEIVFYGGPQPWIIDSSKYFQTLSPENKAIVNHLQQKTFGTNRGYHNFVVSCKDYGEQKLSLEVGNGVTAKNQYPATETVTIVFNCAEPVEIHLQPLVKTPDKDIPQCPVLREQTQAIPVHCNRDHDLLVTVTDSAGRKFDNFSSLDFDWAISDQSLGSLVKDIGLLTEIISSTDGSKKIKYFQTLQPVGKPGIETITTTVRQYRQEYLRQVGSSLYATLSYKISKSLSLRLVEEAAVTPHTISVFNHPSNKVMVDILKGSGYFFVSPVREGIVSLDYSEQKKQIQVKPVSDGSLSITVYDLCIDVLDPPTATVFVSGVGSIRLSVMDKVEVGKELQAKVQVMDIHGTPLLANFFSLMGLKLVPASSIITVRPDLEVEGDQFTAYYIVHGVQVGHTSLEAQAQPQPGVTVTSHTKPVEVFPPLQLIPPNITLIIGALFQVLSKGGPTPQCTVEFSIMDSRISLVSSSGLLNAQELGSTKVIGQAVGQDPESGERVVYSQDEANVHIVLLQGIRIHAPLTRLQTGTKMHMYAVGLTEHETPFSFGSAIPPLTFSWSVNNKDVVHLQNVFHQSNVYPSEQSDFASQLVAHEQGQVTVKLEVTPTRGHKFQVKGHMKLADELQIQVFQKLALISPTICDGKILMTPNTEAVIKTNRDGSAKVMYKVLPSGSQKSGVVTIGDGGTLVSGHNSGEAALHVTSKEEFGTNQTLVVLVKVKPVSYMMINVDTVLKTSGGMLKKVPVGTTLHFSVSYHDNIGEQFYATNVQMHYRCSRYDLIQVGYGMENNTIVMKVSDVGQTILKVWDKQNPWLSDYINIPVDYAISPSTLALSLGEIACFQSPLVSEKGYRGSWYSNNNVMQMEKRSGIATATRVGQAFIIYNITSEVATFTEVSVTPIKTLSMDTSVDFLTNVNSKGHFVTVTLDGENEIMGTNCSGLVSQEQYHPSSIPFTCSLEVLAANSDIDTDKLFTVHPDFDSKSGKFGCQINQGQVEQTSQQSSTLTANVRLTVTVPQQEGQPEITTPVLTFQFLPAFFIHHPEVHLSTVNHLASIRVSTVPGLSSHIQAFVSDPTILEALAPEKDTQSGAVLLYPIRLIETAALWEKDQIEAHVQLVCKKTGQKVKLPVFVSLIGKKPEYLGYRGYTWSSMIRSFLDNYPSWIFILIVIILTAVAVLIGYHVVFGSKFRAAATANSVFLNTSGTASPPGMQYTPPGPLMASAYSPYAVSPKTPYLWSPGYAPVDGNSPLRRRSPFQQRQSPNL